MLPELGRVHCAQGVEVRHGNAVAAPGPGEGAAAADGRVVLGGVRRARVEHQEEGSVLLGVHVAWPGEQVAVGSAFAEDRAHDCIVVVVRWYCGRGKTTNRDDHAGPSRFGETVVSELWQGPQTEV
ncbi:hypothetical protein D3C84_843060 [compost metagenome]